MNKFHHRLDFSSHLKQHSEACARGRDTQLIWIPAKQMARLASNYKLRLSGAKIIILLPFRQIWHMFKAHHFIKTYFHQSNLQFVKRRSFIYHQSFSCFQDFMFPLKVCVLPVDTTTNQCAESKILSKSKSKKQRIRCRNIKITENTIIQNK